MSPTRRPRTGRPPDRTGATGTAPEGSTTILNRSQTNRMAARISGSVAVTIASTCRWITEKGRVPSEVRRPSATVLGSPDGRIVPACKERKASSAAFGSAPTTRVVGERPLTARAVPARRPPPPTGQATRSSGPAWSSSSQAAVPWPAITRQSS